MGTIETISTRKHLTKPSLFKLAAHRGLAAIHYALQVFGYLRGRLAKQKSRMVLRDLSDDHLRDIGKTRSEAEAEASKPFWQ